MVLGIHLADTLPDLTADAQAGIRGLAHRLGKERALGLCWGAFAAATLLTLLLSAVIPYRYEWYLPGLLAGSVLMLLGVSVYLTNHTRIKLMALLLEVGAMVLAVGWVAAITL
jgi:1,4-dihydroxy-2-naphthoate octaprenyltransferase